MAKQAHTEIKSASAISMGNFGSTQHHLLKKMSIEDFNHSTKTHCGQSKEVYSRGKGPPVIILPETPGLHQSVFELGKRISNAGFSVHLLSLFGEDGRAFRHRDIIPCISRLCIRREFHILASNRSSPAAEWVRSFCAELHRSGSHKGLGLIGMCITGNFALSMLAEPWMLAPVLSQPSLPFPRRTGLHVDPTVIKKVRNDPNKKLLGLRFTGDFLCPKQRFKRLSEELPGQFTGIEIDSSFKNSHGISPLAHSVLTKDFVDRQGHPTRAALEKTISFLRERL